MEGLSSSDVFVATTSAKSVLGLHSHHHSGTDTTLLIGMLWQHFMFKQLAPPAVSCLKIKNPITHYFVIVSIKVKETCYKNNKAMCAYTPVAVPLCSER